MSNKVNLKSPIAKEHTFLTEIITSNNTSKMNMAQYRSLYSSTATGIALHELVYNKSGKAVDYRIIDINPYYEKITGLKKDVIGCKASKLYNLNKPPHLKIFKQVLKSKSPLHSLHILHI